MIRLKATLILLGVLVLMVVGLAVLKPVPTISVMGESTPERNETPEIREARAIVAGELIPLMNAFVKRGPPEDQYMLKHLSQRPHISTVEERFGPDALAEATRQLDSRIPAQQVIGSAVDILSAKTYLMIYATFYRVPDPCDGSPCLRFVVEKDTKKVVFVYFVPQG